MKIKVQIKAFHAQLAKIVKSDNTEYHSSKFPPNITDESVNFCNYSDEKSSNPCLYWRWAYPTKQTLKQNAHLFTQAKLLTLSLQRR